MQIVYQQYYTRRSIQQKKIFELDGSDGRDAKQ